MLIVVDGDIVVRGRDPVVSVLFGRSVQVEESREEPQLVYVRSGKPETSREIV